MIVTFHQLTDALAFEGPGKEKDAKLRLIPVPRALSSSCGMCAQTSLHAGDILDIAHRADIDIHGIYETSEDRTVYRRLYGED